MRGALLVLVLLLVVSLSGCILAHPEADDAPLAAPTPGWVSPDDLMVHPPSGIYGAWIPDNVSRLRIRWAEVQVPEPDTAGTDPYPGTDGAMMQAPAGSAHNLLGDLPDLLVLIAPDGTWRFAGSGSLRIDVGPEGMGPGNITLPTLPDRVLIDEVAPDPGLYRFVLYGHQVAPIVEIHHEGTPPRLAPLAPLPLVVERTTLHDPPAGPNGILGADADWAVPVGTVVAWGDLRGIGIDGRLTFTTTDGTVVADHRRTLLADPAGTSGVLLGIDRIFDFDQVAPDALHDRALHWETRGTGTATVFGYTAVATSMHAPWIPPAPAAEKGHDKSMADEERIPLEGTLGTREPGAFRLPPDARVSLVLSSGDFARYRIYDAHGTRLHWGTLGEPGALLELPPGPLAIINDGPGRIEVEIVGAAPTDAVLHPIGTDIQSHTIPLGDLGGGSDQAHLRAVFTGPVLHVATYHMGTLGSPFVSIVRDDGATVSTLPDLADMPPGETYCCPFPGIGGYDGDAHWIDPGVHALRIRTTSGQGDITFDAEILRLSELTTLGDEATDDGQDGK